MKIIFLLLSFLLLRISSHSIILVHIGTTIPVYMNDCIRQIRLFNTCDVYLIASEEALQKYTPLSQDGTIILVPCESLEKSVYHKKFLQNGRLKYGFWQFSTERFFYIDELAKKLNLVDIFHMEYDNMLYVDLAKLVVIFQHHYPYCGGTFDNDERCIPGFMYFRNKDSVNKLVSFLSEPELGKKNDMESIVAFKKKYKSRNYINSLPIILKEYSMLYPFISKKGHTVSKSSYYYNNIEYFNSIFDAAAIGQYLGGIDPAHNTDSKPGFINESCIFNPSFLEYKWILDECNRKVPYVIFKGSAYRINNLHIHSKNLKTFSS